MKKSPRLFLLFCYFYLCYPHAAQFYTTKESEAAFENGHTQDTLDEEDEELYITVGMHIILPYWQDHRSGLEAAGKRTGT